MKEYHPKASPFGLKLILWVAGISIVARGILWLYDLIIH